MAERFTLSALAVDALRTRLRTTIAPLTPASDLGAPDAERSDSHREAWLELDAMGLLDRGEPIPFLATAFHALHRPSRSVTGSFLVKSLRLNAIAAASGEFAVLATQSESSGTTETDLSMTIERIRPTSLARVVIEVLPPVQAGQGTVVRLPSHYIQRATDEGILDTARLPSAIASAGLRHEDAEVLERVLTAPREREGQISATGFDPLACRTTDAAYRVEFLDTADGRYLTQHRTEPDGREWFTLAPADRTMLIGQVEILLSSIGPRI
ncbi:MULTISPECIES: ESX secretion-associated protein EspG [Actinoalloteichus]|nr:MULTISPECIES: ESX secretion-associated protein EspG [Actinoalloteichus]